MTQERFLGHLGNSALSVPDRAQGGGGRQQGICGCSVEKAAYNMLKQGVSFGGITEILESWLMRSDCSEEASKFLYYTQFEIGRAHV